MTNTFLTTTRQEFPAFGIGVTTPTQYVPSGAATLPMLAAKMPAKQATFIQNVHPVLTPSAPFINIHQVRVFVVTTHDIHRATSREWLQKRRKWSNEEYRHNYMESAIEQGVAWQIKINREKRCLSQTDLARRIGSKQSAISRAEDTTYGRHRLETLVKIANAFDCALQIKFIPYSKLAKDSADLTPAALYAKSYEEEIA